MTDPKADREMAAIQGRTADLQPEIAGVITSDRPSLGFKGKDFRIADNIGLMPLLKFADASEIAVQDARAMSAMYALLRDCIYPGEPACGECGVCAPPPCGECEGCTDPPGGEIRCYQAGDIDETRCPSYDAGDWSAFEHHAIDTRADADELFDFLNETLELITGRPTKPPATSSNGHRSSSRGSTGNSSGRRGKASRR